MILISAKNLAMQSYTFSHCQQATEDETDSNTNHESHIDIKKPYVGKCEKP